MRWTGRFVRFFRRAKTGLAKVAKWLWGNRIKAMKWLWSKIVKVGKGFCWLLGKAKTGLVRVAKWLFKVAKWLRSELVRVAKWLRGKIIRVAKWLRSELVRVAKWLFKVAKWLRGELVRVAKWLWGKLVVAGKWLVATMASENKKAIRSYAIGAGVLLLTVWLVDFAWDINILSRWWLVKILLCRPALFLISLAQKRWEEEKIPVMWGLVKFFVIVIFAGWIIRSQDARDFVNWCKGPASTQVSKRLTLVFEKSYTFADAFNEYGQIDTFKFVDDGVNEGDKVEVIAKPIDGGEFSGKEIGIWQGEKFSPPWDMTVNGYYSIVIESAPEGNIFMISLNSRKDLRVTVRVIRGVNFKS